MSSPPARPTRKGERGRGRIRSARKRKLAASARGNGRKMGGRRTTRLLSLCLSLSKRLCDWIGSGGMQLRAFSVSHVEECQINRGEAKTAIGHPMICRVLQEFDIPFRPTVQARPASSCAYLPPARRPCPIPILPPPRRFLPSPIHRAAYLSRQSDQTSSSGMRCGVVWGRSTARIKIILRLIRERRFRDDAHPLSGSVCSLTPG